MKFIRVICFLLISSFSAELLADAWNHQDGQECCSAKPVTEKDDDLKKEKEDTDKSFGIASFQLQAPHFPKEYAVENFQLHCAAFLSLPDMPPDMA